VVTPARARTSGTLHEVEGCRGVGEVGVEDGGVAVENKREPRAACWEGVLAERRAVREAWDQPASTPALLRVEENPPEKAAAAESVRGCERRGALVASPEAREVELSPAERAKASAEGKDG